MPGLIIFPEVLDTVRTSPNELAIGSAFLKLLMLAPEGAMLTTTHAIDSTVLLQPSAAGDFDFLTMVQAGRIRFARWPDGKGPRQAFTAALAFPPETYRLSAWPELQDSTCRGNAAAVWSGGSSSTGLPDVDARLDRAKRLFSAAEFYEARYGVLTERVRDDKFGRAVEGIPSMIDNMLPRSMRMTAAALATLDGRNSRSKVYTRIDGDVDLEADEKTAMKDLVDGLYNETVATALGLPYLSVRRTWRGKLPYHSARAEPLQVALVPHVDPGVLAPASWASLRQAQPGMPNATKEEAAAAFHSVLAGIGRYRHGLMVGGIAAVGTAAAVANVLLQGAAHEWALTILFAYASSVLASEPFEALGRHLDEKWAEGQAEAFYGWLDRLEALSRIREVEARRT